MFHGPRTHRRATLGILSRNNRRNWRSFRLPRRQIRNHLEYSYSCKERRPTPDEDADSRKRAEEPPKYRDRDVQNTKDRDPPKDATREIPKVKKYEGDDPASEIINRLLELEKKDEAFGTTLENKFKEMQQKLESMEKDQLQTLNRVYQGLDSIRSAVDVNRIEELKSDVKSALAALNKVQNRIDSIETHVEGTNKKTADLHDLHDKNARELLDQLEQSSTWGFWTYFLIFQVLFWAAFVWWKKTQDDKSKKFL